MKDIKNFMTGFTVSFDLKLNKDNLDSFKLLFKKSTINKLIKKVKIYNEYKNYLINENSNRISFVYFPSKKIYNDYSHYFKKPGQYKVAIYCGNACTNASDIAKRIFENNKCDFFISWIYNFDKKEYVLTLRSELVDVGNIAKLFNGGGHLYAAAFSFKENIYKIQDLFM